MKGVLQFVTLLAFVVSIRASQKQEFTILSNGYESPINVVFSTPPHEMTLAITPNSDIVLSNHDKEVLHYDPKKDTLATSYNLKVGSDIILENQPNDIYFMDTEQWKLYYIEDFQGYAQGWSHTTLSSCGASSDLFLGGHCNFANDVVTKTLNNLPEHRMIRLKFNIHFFGNWNGQSAYAKVDDQYVWAESYNWCTKVLPWYCKKYGIFACGTEYPDRLGHPVEYIGKHYANSVTFTFSSNLENNPCQASWGIDDVQVFLI